MLAVILTADIILLTFILQFSPSLNVDQPIFFAYDFIAVPGTILVKNTKNTLKKKWERE